MKLTVTSTVRIVSGERAPVQGERIARDECPPGTVSWEEHEEAWRAYSKRYGTDQSAARIAERGGFGLFELCVFLKHPPKTWEPRS